MVLRSEGRRLEAMDLLQRAMALSRETGISFMGPWILGHLAVATEDPVVRRKALAEGEEVLSRGSVGHNHLWFRRYAVEAFLNSKEWDEAARHAAALEDYTQAEPLPWADFFVAYGRTLAAHGRGQHRLETVHELGILRHQAKQLGIGTALVTIDRALTAE